jgi:hypothetical protein
MARKTVVPCCALLFGSAALAQGAGLIQRLGIFIRGYEKSLSF